MSVTSPNHYLPKTTKIAMNSQKKTPHVVDFSKFQPKKLARKKTPPMTDLEKINFGPNPLKKSCIKNPNITYLLEHLQI